MAYQECRETECGWAVMESHGDDFARNARLSFWNGQHDDMTALLQHDKTSAKRILSPKAFAELHPDQEKEAAR